MKKILCIAGKMDAGGAETFLMKLFRNMDKSKFVMDFCVFTDEEGVYDKEILSFGGKIFHAVMKSKHPVKSFISVKKTVRQNGYDYVMRMSDNAISSMDLLAARLGGAKVLVFRCTNSVASGGTKGKIGHFLLKPFLNILVKIKMAPSTKAAEFMFGKNCIKKRKAFLLNNALDVNLYTYDSEMRSILRNEFNISEDSFVIGHVGRFNFQKNHNFIIDVFKKIAKKNSKAVLLLVGGGELSDKIKGKVMSYGLSDKVIFAGVRNDANKILSAFDVLLFPSLFEGMPNVVIEAQAAGLHCVISDTITKEADITGLVEYLPLSLRPKVWADAVLKYSEGYERHGMEQIFLEKGYDIKSITERFVKLVF